MKTLGGVLALLQFLFVNVHLLLIKTTACNASAEPSQLLKCSVQKQPNISLFNREMNSDII